MPRKAFRNPRNRRVITERTPEGCGELHARRQTKNDTANSNNHDTANGNNYDTANSNNYDTANSNNYDTANSNNYDTANSNNYDTATACAAAPHLPDGYGVRIWILGRRVPGPAARFAARLRPWLF